MVRWYLIFPKSSLHLLFFIMKSHRFSGFKSKTIMQLFWRKISVHYKSFERNLKIIFTAKLIKLSSNLFSFILSAMLKLPSELAATCLQTRINVIMILKRIIVMYILYVSFQEILSFQYYWQLVEISFVCTLWHMRRRSKIEEFAIL